MHGRAIECRWCTGYVRKRYSKSHNVTLSIRVYSKLGATVVGDGQIRTNGALGPHRQLLTESQIPQHKDNSTH